MFEGGYSFVVGVCVFEEMAVNFFYAILYSMLIWLMIEGRVSCFEDNGLCGWREEMLYSDDLGMVDAGNIYVGDIDKGELLRSLWHGSYLKDYRYPPGYVPSYFPSVIYVKGEGEYVGWRYKWYYGRYIGSSFGEDYLDGRGYANYMGKVGLITAVNRARCWQMVSRKNGGFDGGKEKYIGDV